MDTERELEARVAGLERLVEAQQEEIRRLREGAPPGADPGEPVVVDRRSMLRTVGVAAVGAAIGGAAVVTSASPAAAANGSPILMGQTTTGTAATVAAVSPIGTTGFAFADDTSFVPSLPAPGTPSPVVTIAAGSNSGLYASSGLADGVTASGGEYGIQTQGGLAALRLTGTAALAPTLDTHAHRAGEFVIESTPSGYFLWFCVKEGTPGDWSMLAGPDITSTFSPVSPQRLYDSRNSDGALSSGQTRVVNLGVPPSPGAAYLLNLTVTNTTGSGFLQLYSNAQATPPSASSINWFTANQIAANSTVTQVDAGGLAKVRAGGGGSAQFVIDLMGWYR